MLQRKFDYTYFLLVVPTLAASLPWFSYRIRPFIPFVFLVAWAIFTPKNCCAVRNIRQFRKVFVSLIVALTLYHSSQIVFALLGYGDFPRREVWTTALIQGSMVLIPYLSIKYGKIRELLVITLLYLSGFFLTGIFARNASMLYSGMEFSRALTYSDVNSLEAQNVAFLGKTMGIGGYEYMYTCALLIPVLFAAILPLKRKGWFKRVGLLFIVVISSLLSLKNGGLGTPFLILFVGVLLFMGNLLSNKSNSVNYVGAFALIAYILFISWPKFYSPVAFVLRNVGDLFSVEGSISYRFNSLADMISGDLDSYANIRYDTQRLSWIGFTESPIYGWGAFNPSSTMNRAADDRLMKCGGHSMMLDRMSTQGIIGIIPFFAYFVFLNKFYRSLPYELFGDSCAKCGKIYIYSFLVASIANPFNTFLSFGYFLPGVVLLMRNPNIHLNY